MTGQGLELVGLVKRFGNHAVVNGAALSVKPGEIVAVLGPSGCGKTTMLRLIAGFEQLDAGRIELGGVDLIGLPAFQRKIGLVFQDYALFPHMSVAGNIDYGMRLQGRRATERARRRTELLRMVRLEGLEERRPAALSGGQQQRVAVARALAIEPRLLLLDEPLSNLDAKLREALRTELREILRAVGLTTIVVTHDQLEAIGLADRIALMNKGRFVQVGTAREIYEQPASRFVAEFVGQSLWFSGRLAHDGSARFDCEDGNSFLVTRPQQPGARYGLSIRPEHVHLAARPEDENHITAVVESVDFFGAELIVNCRMATGGRKIAVPARSDDPAIPSAGDTVKLGIAAARCRVVDDQ